MSDKTAPTANLQLEWVYGYRGHQCRNNVLYTANNHIVYFVAGVGITYNLQEHKQKFFLGHDDDIISLALHPNKQLVATGQIGKSPYVCVWNTATQQTVSILKDGHTDGISVLAFSQDGSRLVSIGLDQNATMNVWDWEKGKVMSTTRAHSDRVFDCQFRSNDPTEMVTCGVKHIKFWKLVGNTLSSRKGVFGKVGEIQSLMCVALGPDDVAYTGTLSGDVYVWKGNQLDHVVRAVHPGGAFSINTSPDGYVTGGKDGIVRLFDISFQALNTFNLNKSAPASSGSVAVRSVCWNRDRVVAGTQDSSIFEIVISERNSQPPRQVMAGHTEGELWALAVHPKKPIFATGSDDKSLRVWHIPDHELLSCITVQQNIRSCAFNDDGNLIAVGFVDGSFSVLRAKDLTEVIHTKERKEVLHEMKFSPDGKLLAVGSNDNFVDIYDVVQKFKKVGECRGSSSFITHLDWSKDSQYLQTNSGAAERLIFRAPTGKHITNSEEIRVIRWASWTGVLGNEVSGIWEKYTDTNDVNATDVQFSSEVIATGDDFGLVKLFRFPTTIKGSRFRKYVGHSAHVTNVRWSQDGSRLISIGGSDHAIFQWRLQTGSAVPVDNMDPDEVHPTAYTDSNTEASDSGLSDVGACDSEIEREKTENYIRPIYREDLQSIAKDLNAEMAGQRRKKAPSQGLTLEFVHGYRGYDCRNNLFYLQSGEIVYHVAAVGIVYNKTSHTQKFYKEHTDDILCLALHPIRDYVATGQVGRDPTIHIWEAESSKTLSILKGQHERGVCAVDFSNDGKKLASVGLDDNHTIVVWDWKSGEKLATTRGNKDKIFVIKYNPHDTNRLVAVGVKFIRFWTQAGGGFTGQRGTFGTVAKLDTLMCAAYSPTDSEVCYTGGANGMVYVWKGNVLERVVKAHEGGCFAMHSLENGFVTGGKDGKVSLYDETFTKVYRSYTVSRAALTPDSRGTLTTECPTIRAAVLGKANILVGTKDGEVLEISKEGPIRVLAQGHSEGELWGLAVHPRLPVCATVSDDGSVRVWEISLGKHRMARHRLLGKPARSIGFSSDGSSIAIGFRDGSVTVLKADTLQDISTQHHRKEEISDVKFSPDQGKYLAVGSHDNFVDIYNVFTQERVGVCKGASSYITHVDWDAKGKLIVVNTGAKEQLFFEAPRGTRQTPSKSDIENMLWASWTGVLGDTCVGIWPPKSDVTDVNMSSLSSSGDLLATGDDFGFVKLFDYPAKTKFAKYKQYTGHSAHVTNVQWLKDDSYLLSIGGADTALMVWRHRFDTTAGAQRPPSVASTKQNGPVSTDARLTVSGGGGASDLSDTDSEEEGGYDSDVDHEKKMNYAEKTYSSTTSLQERNGVRPGQQKVQDGDLAKQKLKPNVSRQAPKAPKVAQPKSAGTEPPIESRRASRQGLGSSVQKSVPVPPTPVLTEVTDLDLAHVNGYRGFDCRNNVHYVDGAATEIVYHAAGVGIVHNLNNSVQRFFLDHTDDILCLTVNRHPKFRGVVATGQLGQTPPIHVWQTDTCATLSTLQGPHTAGVCALDFSCSGKLLVSVGLDDRHTIAVWRWEEGSLLGSSPGHSLRIFCVEFRPDSDSQFVSVGVKHVKFWSVAGSQIVSKRGLLRDPSGTGNLKMTTMLSIAFGTDNVTFTGAMSGDVWVWKDQAIQRIVQKAHTGPVFTLYTTLKDGLIVSGGKEKGKDTGSVKLWDQDMRKFRAFNYRETASLTGYASPIPGSTGAAAAAPGPPDGVKIDVIKSVCRTKGKLLVGTKGSEVLEINEKTGTIDPVIRGHGEGELWGLTVHPLLPKFATGSDDGTVRIWDIGDKSMQHKLNTGPARSLHYSFGGDFLAVGLKTGGVLLLNAISLKLLAKRRDRSKSITDIRFSPDSRYLAAGGEEQCVDIYEIVAPGTDSSVAMNRVGYCKGIPSFVIQMDWSVDSKCLRVSTGAYQLHGYAIPSGDPIEDKDLNNMTWASWTSILGPEVLGIWPVGAGKEDVNCTHLNHVGNSLVTGDDYGLVKLFTFPSPTPNAPCRTYVGHSAHVTNVRFSCDDSHMISIGGDDCCIFVWKCK